MCEIIETIRFNIGVRGRQTVNGKNAEDGDNDEETDDEDGDEQQQQQVPLLKVSITVVVKPTDCRKPNKV